ncbi:MAG: tellurium resistance protein TerC [Gammaproteobacteria bacterium]|nr:tellurium resistance protein TerC [Gammaproteobacteria bacterium]MDH3468484.1 tellurium resistance protein TerC [Gammaproteobacteria bacterium]
MESIFNLDNLITLGLLTLLQAVLGFDNLLYISLESKHAPPESQAAVRRFGITIAIVLRIVLLFGLISVIRFFQNPLFDVQVTGIIEGVFNIHSLIVLLGGILIIYTATKEIWHMMGLEELEHEKRSRRSVRLIVFWIVAMNLVFSFDSILSAIALTDVFWIMAAAIVISGLLMIWLSDRVAEFLQKNRMYEVLGLFILLVVGIMLLSEGGHLAHLKFADQEIVPMSKATFYFVITVLVISDIVQSRYRKRLLKLKQAATMG